MNRTGRELRRFGLYGAHRGVFAARHAGVDVIVVADTYKLTSARFSMETQPAAQVWASPPPGVRVENVTFEAVAADRIDYIVFEDAVLRPSGVERLFDRARGMP